jgi:hypothetical protein
MLHARIQQQKESTFIGLLCRLFCSEEISMEEIFLPG